MLYRRVRGNTQLAQPCSLWDHALVFERRRGLDVMQLSRTYSGTLVLDSCMGLSAVASRHCHQLVLFLG